MYNLYNYTQNSTIFKQSILGISDAISQIQKIRVAEGLNGLFDATTVQQYTLAISGLNKQEAITLLQRQGLSTAQQAQILSSAGLLQTTQMLNASLVEEAVLNSKISGEKAEQILTELGVIEAKTGNLIVTKECTVAEVAQALATKGIVGADAEAILSQLGLTTANTATTASFAGLTTAIKANTVAMTKWLVTNPVGWCILAVGAIYGLTKAYDALTVSEEEMAEAHEESVQKAKDSISEYEELKQELETIQQTYDDNEQKLKDLYKLRENQTITQAEQDYLEELEGQNEKLRQQIEYKQTLADIEAKEAEDDAVMTLNEKTQDDLLTGHSTNGGATVEFDKITDAEKIKQNTATINALTADLTAYEKVIQGIGLSQEEVDKYTQQLVSYQGQLNSIEGNSDSANANRELLQGEIDKIQRLLDGTLTYEEYEKAVSGATSSVQSLVTENDALLQKVEPLNDAIKSTSGENYELKKTNDEIIANAKDAAIGFNKYTDSLNGTADALNNVQSSTLDNKASAFTFTEENTKAIDDYRSKISTLATALDDLEAGNDIDMSELYEAFPTLMKTSDDLDVALKKLIDGELETLYETLGNPPESLKRALEKLADQAKNISISIDDVTNAFSNLKNAASTLEDIKTEIEESGELSASSLDDIIQAYPEMIGYVGQYATGVISVSELYQQLQKAYETDKENYKETLKAKLETDANFYEAVFANNQEYIKVMNSLYGTDYENWKTVAQAKKEINNTLIKQLSADWNKYYNAIYNAETNRYSLQTNGTALKEDATISNLSQSTQKQLKQQSKENQEANKNKAQKYVNNANKALAELEKGLTLNDLDLSSTALATGDDSKKDKKDEFSQTFNWVETLLDKLSKKTEELKEKFEEAFSLTKAKTAFKKAIDQITKEIKQNEKAVEYYEKKANGVKLSSKYKKLVDSGALKIEDITDEALAKRIELYQDYKDKAEACRDTIDDLRDSYAELADTFYSKPLEVRDNNIEEFTTQLELLDSKIENATSAKERENYAKQKESLYKKEYNSYVTAEETTAKYLKSAKSNINQKSDKALKGLTDKQKATITNAVKKGVEITDAIIDMDSLTPEALKAIENYNSALKNNKQSASDAAQAEQDLAQNIRENKQVKIDSKQDEIDNLKAQYENLDENDWKGRNANLDEQIKKTNTLYKLMIDQETDVVRKEQLRAELNKEIADLTEQQVENIRTYWQNVGNLEGSIADERNSKQDYLEASSKDTVASRVENYNTTAFQSRKEAVAKLEEAKTFDPNKADYHSAMSEYWSLMAQASEAEYNVWKESVLGVYDSVIDEVTKKGDDLEKAIELDEVKGIEKDEYDYIALINQASAEIAVNQNKIEQLQQKQQEFLNNGGSTESTVYKDLQSQIEECEDAIYDNEKAQIEYDNALANLPLEKLEKELELLDAVGNRLSSENDLKEKQGKDLSIEDYQREMDNQKNIAADMQNQANIAYQNMLKAMSSKDGTYGGKTAKEWETDFNNFQASALDAESTWIELKNEMRDDIFWRDFNRKMDNLQHKSDMLSSIGDLISDKMKFD